MNGLLASQAVTLVLAVSTGYVAGEHIAKAGWWQYDALEGPARLLVPDLPTPGMSSVRGGGTW